MHSVAEHEIIVIINEGKDGTTEWVKKQTDLKYIHFVQNAGICIGLNRAADMATTNHVLYINDDMYVLPQWDQHIINEIKSLNHELYMLSATMIEPTDTGNPCVIVANFGDSLETFQEADLLSTYTDFFKSDWNGSTWPPNLLPLSLWQTVGGMSEEFSPGMYSDPDLSKKCWDAGVRHFRGMGEGKVYHFGSKSTKKLGKNVGRELFKKKWGMSSNTFTNLYLRRGQNWTGPLPEPKVSIAHRLKILWVKWTK